MGWNVGVAIVAVVVVVVIVIVVPIIYIIDTFARCSIRMDPIIIISNGLARRGSRCCFVVCTYAVVILSLSLSLLLHLLRTLRTSIQFWWSDPINPSHFFSPSFLLLHATIPHRIKQKVVVLVQKYHCVLILLLISSLNTQLDTQL